MKKYNILALWLGCLTIFGLDANDIKLKSSDGKEFVVDAVLFDSFLPRTAFQSEGRELFESGTLARETLPLFKDECLDVDAPSEIIELFVSLLNDSTSRKSQMSKMSLENLLECYRLADYFCMQLIKDEILDILRALSCLQEFVKRYRQLMRCTKESYAQCEKKGLKFLVDGFLKKRFERNLLLPCQPMVEDFSLEGLRVPSVTVRTIGQFLVIHSLREGLINSLNYQDFDTLFKEFAEYDVLRYLGKELADKRDQMTECDFAVRFPMFASSLYSVLAREGSSIGIQTDRRLTLRGYVQREFALGMHQIFDVPSKSTFLIIGLYAFSSGFISAKISPNLGVDLINYGLTLVSIPLVCSLSARLGL
ncbi:TPA: hypothetical protein DIC20_02795 [Candidatus Dependentiae bacterium]|nr:hypothetical protein [Candidatus Dependentiae bacterium]HCU00608.1 hypothetical protein [Candidatus Dependentiae bacterium]